jgi:hypothetical protein
VGGWKDSEGRRVLMCVLGGCQLPHVLNLSSSSISVSGQPKNQQ